VRDVVLGDGRGILVTRWGDWLAYLSLAAVAVTVLFARGVGSRSSTP
jgi:hypothetical protein